MSDTPRRLLQRLEDSSGCIHLDFSKVFDTVSHNIFIYKLMKFILHKWTVRWTENCLNYLAQKIIISCKKCSCRLVTSSVTQGPIRGPIFFNTFSHNLDDGIDCSLSKFTGDMNLGIVIDKPDEHAVIQRDMTDWKNGLTRTSSSSTKRRAKSCSWGGTTPCTSICWGLTSRKAVFQKRT